MTGDQLPPLPIVTADINQQLRKRLASDSSGRWKVVVDNLSAGNFREGLESLDELGASEDEWLRDYLKASNHVWLDDYEQAAKVGSGAALANHPSQAVQMLRAEIFRQISIEYFDRLVSGHPDSCRAHLVKAMNFAAQEKAEAEAEFKAAIAGCPFATEVRIELADYYLWNSQHEEARQACLDELKIHRHSSAAKKRLGRIHVQLRDAEKAFPDFHAAAETDPEDSDVRTDLGRAYELREKWEEAAAEYRRALDLNPTLNRVHYVLARIYRKMGQPDRAREQFRQFKENEEAARLARVERIQRLRQREASEPTGP